MKTIKVNLESKDANYQNCIQYIEISIKENIDYFSLLSDVVAVLKQSFNFFWVGFYRVVNGQLLVGPYQGDIACTTIEVGKGVCGTSWQNKRTIIVPDVNKFEGHIACSAQSKSEIVVPIIKNKEVIAVIDIDSDKIDSFDAIDQKYLEQIANLVSKFEH